jgi:glycerol-3-phosphate acyltransferase PlsY
MTYTLWIISGVSALLYGVFYQENAMYLISVTVETSLNVILAFLIIYYNDKNIKKRIEKQKQKQKQK